MRKLPLYPEIFAVSLAAILLEIAYTRIFSFKVYYLFTYLIIGVGLSGLGAGGVLVTVWKRLREMEPGRLVANLSLLASACAAGGYPLIAKTRINVEQLASGPAEMAKLALLCAVLALPFLAAGIIIASILSNRPEAAGRLYGADLLGAALGCAAAVPLLTDLGPPATVMLSSLLFAAASLRTAARSKALLPAAAAICTGPLLALFDPRLLPDPAVDRAKHFDNFRQADLIEFSQWHPVFRVDVAEHPLVEQRGSVYILLHDGQPGSGLRPFNGNIKTLEYLVRDPRALPFSVLPPEPRVLIIGAAGGQEILASLYFGASQVTAVELNPVTVSLLTDTYAELTGRLAEDPRVDLINGEGRWFLQQSRDTYDLIWFVAPDSYAAMNASSSGAYVLSESYLYTVETLQQSLERLSENGVICAQFGEIDYANRPNRTTRYLTTARRAFTGMGIGNFSRRVLLASSPGFPPFEESIVLLARTPFDSRAISGFGEALREIKGGQVRYVHGRERLAGPPHYAITLPETQLDKLYAKYPYLVDPVRDDSPFFWHFTGFTRALFDPPPQTGSVLDFENGIGEQVAVVLLALVTALAAALLLLPLLAIRKTWLEVPHKTRVGIYFASLGLGFMFIEVVLIQMFTLFLGYPTYSLSVTLFGMLVFSGIGSLLSDGYSGRRNWILLILVSLLAAIILAYRLLLPPVIEAFIGHALAMRIGLVTLLIAPLGMVLGSFMPVGLRSVAGIGSHRRQLVAWAWAVNGFFSVIASVLCTILAMVIGFKMVLALALVVYGVGVLALAGIPSNEEKTAG